jgi:hypothetical protein
MAMGFSTTDIFLNSLKKTESRSGVSGFDPFLARMARSTAHKSPRLDLIGKIRQHVGQC